MATITITAVETGQPTLTKVFNFVDTDMDKMVLAYQSMANASINGIATRAQVFNFIVMGWATQIKNQIQQSQTVIPTPIVIT